MVTNRLDLIEKKELIPHVYLFQFQVEKKISYTPGQYMVLQIDARIFRSYSIVNLNESEPQNLTLLIDTKIGGPASFFFEKMAIGENVNLIGNPVGKMVIKPTPNAKVFVATGTGLAPFIPMIATALHANPQEKISLLFGSRQHKEDYSEQFFQEFLNEKYPNFHILHCLSRHEGELPQKCHSGRVTQILETQIQHYANTEFYLCGNPAMVEDAKKLLLEKGAGHIHGEKYGN